MNFNIGDIVVFAKGPKYREVLFVVVSQSGESVQILPYYLNSQIIPFSHYIHCSLLQKATIEGRKVVVSNPINDDE